MQLKVDKDTHFALINCFICNNCHGYFRTNQVVSVLINLVALTVLKFIGFNFNNVTFVIAIVIFFVLFFCGNPLLPLSKIGFADDPISVFDISYEVTDDGNENIRRYKAAETEARKEKLERRKRLAEKLNFW